MNRFLLGLVIIGTLLACNNNKDMTGWRYNEPFTDPDPRWARIDSLNRIGQYATALVATDSIVDEARTANDWRLEFRAMMRRATFQRMTGVETKTVIGEFEARAATASFPLKQLLHSVIAESWWQQYQEDRWAIMERTNTAPITLSGIAEQDPDTWSQQQFMQKVTGEFRASLEPADSLKAYAAGELGPLLLNGENIHLRPTLFDVLSHRALEVFHNTETRLAEPAWSFKLTDPHAFALFEEFANKPLAHRDSTSWEFQALRLHQQLEKLHLSEARPDALVDVTLSRLAYVREHSTLPNKDTLYLNALERLATRLPNDTCWGEVLNAQAQWHREMGDRYERALENAPTTAPWKWERRTALALCDQVIARYPASFAARNSQALKARLLEPSLQLQAEEAVLPEQPFRIALTYANTKQVWVRVIADKMTVNGRAPQHDHESWLLNERPLKEWNVALPDDGDLNAHLIELPVEGLAFGHYSILVCSAPAFAKRADVIQCASFWSTSLAIAQRNKGSEQEALILDRGTGIPLPNVIARYYVRNWQNGGDRFVGSELKSSDAEGLLHAPLAPQGGEVIWSLTKDGDEYISGQYYAYPDRVGTPGPELRTFLFLDRAIYRPGQPIEFKGIATVKNGQTTEVRTNVRTQVRLFDTNGELVDSLDVQTDSYGSFKGKFTAPGGLTGGMRIEETNGSQYFQVEEYKRPTFEVVFDPVTATPKLEQQAEVTGVAKSYSGVPLDGAHVQWTVTRNARMPWWCGWGWRGFPGWGASTEIASGTTDADASGKYMVKFLATADPSLPREADPTFTYTIEASVTDINGETQSSSTALSVGYRSIDIALNVGESIDRSASDSIDVRIQNLNGQDVDVPMGVRINELIVPDGAPELQRLWERPDRRLAGASMADPTHDDPAAWKVKATVLSRSAYRATTKRLALSGIKDWPVGSYLIEVVAKDADGQTVMAKKHVTLFDPAIQNTGFLNEAFHVEGPPTAQEPGEKAVLLISTALPEANVLMEIERDGVIAAKRWFKLSKGQQRIEIPVTEEDRGGFVVHFLCVERGRSHPEMKYIVVPWTNKQLQVQWITFRDKLLPGAKEEWRLKITGPKGEKVAAQLLAGMYDASLDHFVPHGWDMSIWDGNYPRLQWTNVAPFGLTYAQEIWRETQLPNDSARTYPWLDTYGWGDYRRSVVRGARGAEVYSYAVAMDGDAVSNHLEAGNAQFTPSAPGAVLLEDVTGKDKETGTGQQPSANGPQPVRTDFRETAFFFPDLLTDKDGSVILRFSMPEALTRWKLLGLVHTQDLKIAQFTKETITQKPLMVTPNLPRFLRAGDRITLTAKVSALEGGSQVGNAGLELYDPYTNAAVSISFGLKSAERPFSVAPGQSANVSWDITIPEGVDVVSVRITANAGGHSDGEEKPLPILTDKVLVTESLPLWSSKAGTKTFTLEKLKNNASTTLKHQSLKLEYTPNPAWYAVQALPYLMEFPHECAEQTFSRYYANALAAHIVNERPAIKKVFEQWKGNGETSFASALEKNTDLKNIILAETPWVLNAKSDRERKERIALLFDLGRMSAEEDAALKKLSDMQLGNGAWPWWTGMHESRYITQHIVAGFGHLEQLGAADLRPDGQVQAMLRNAVQWLDNEVDREYRELQRHTKKEDMDKYVPNGNDIHYLYARSFFPRWPIDGATSGAVEFYKERLRTTWLRNGLQEQAMAALSLYRLGDKATAQLIMESLKQRATQSEELGMYWKDFLGGYDWWQFPAETHALLVEAFHEVADDNTSVNALRTYLLKLKQTTDWKTTKATSEACYALLLTGSEWLSDNNAPSITVGSVTLSPSKGGSEPGTGAMERTWNATEIKPAMGEVSITSTADKPSWGALHWQYFEQMDKVTPHESPFNIRKEVMLTEQTDAGARLIPLNAGRALKADDKLTIRIELRTDRYVDYVHMKDLRAAGLEPTEAISGYKYQGGLGYYESIRDASMNFFFDRIAPGTYVFEYTLRVTHAGNFSNGITTAMCMYAPEFSSHSAGTRIEVAK